MNHYQDYEGIYWFNMTNIIPHNPDDGSVEPKRYSVDFASL